jgi:hypothetical protein
MSNKTETVWVKFQLEKPVHTAAKIRAAGRNLSLQECLAEIVTDELQTAAFNIIHGQEMSKPRKAVGK